MTTTGRSDIELQPMGSDTAVGFNSLVKQDGDNHRKNDNNNNEEEAENDDDMTIIFLETEGDLQNQGYNADINNGTSSLPNWVDRLDSTGDSIFNERRRTILLQELKRIQRRSFLNFAVLCAIPVVLFVTMIIIVFSGDSDQACESDISYCRLEQRSFVNAFTTRCLCDPIPVERNTTFG